MAAEAGVPEAMHNRASRLDFGDRVAEDQREAMMWYRWAAEGGDRLAMYVLAWRLEERGMPGDRLEAAEWFQRAHESGLDRELGRDRTRWSWVEGLSPNTSDEAEL
jgi:TPR repeat protein